MNNNSTPSAKKYEITDIVHPEYPDLYRIRALRDIELHGVKAGDLGGYVGSERNLWQFGNAWVGGDATVSGNAHVYGNAIVHGNASVTDYALVSGNAKVYGNAAITDEAYIIGSAEIGSGTHTQDTITFNEESKTVTITREVTEEELLHVIRTCPGEWKILS